MNEYSIYEKHSEETVLALGFFDCIHKGHRQIIAQCIEEAKRNNCSSAIMTFTNNLHTSLGSAEKLIYTYAERLEVLKDLGLDAVIGCQFDVDFMKKSGVEFLNLLLANFNVTQIVCGYDYTYGCDRQNMNDLQNFCQSKGIALTVITRYDINGKRVSTTEIKSLLAKNKILRVNKLLGRDFSISGIVCTGRSVGKNLGFPTANLELPPDKFLPQGVFSAVTRIDDKEYPAVVNIGARPTFGLTDITVEVHIIGFFGNLYGQLLTISLTEFLREITNFDTPQQLVEQLKKDCLYANKIWTQR